LIDPMTPKPPHPSYPGGHAAQTHTLALLLAQLRPSASVDLLKRAAEISENRVIAGWHYPSDNAAGVLLAQQFVDLLLHNGDAVDMLEAARAEWPLT
jgi:membrane-associated phospholipid phosphatase